jgi:hypothetical protein
MSYADFQAEGCYVSLCSSSEDEAEIVMVGDGAVQEAGFDEAPVVGNTNSSVANIPSIECFGSLKAIGMLYLEEFQYMICVNCESFVSADYLRHAQTRHNLSLPKDEKKVLMSSIFVKKFEVSEIQPVKPFPSVKTRGGFGCKMCFQGCFSDIRNIRAHVRNEHMKFADPINISGATDVCSTWRFFPLCDYSKNKLQVSPTNRKR